MNFYQELDKLLVAHNIDGAHDFLKKSLNDALIAHDTASVIAILNELIGFLRDITKNEESSMYAKRLKALVDNNNLDEKSLFISYINIANAYRANLELDEAIIVFMEALDIYNINNIDDKVSLAALYNNLGLAYQGLLKYEESIKYLLCALDIVKDTNNDIKVATTYVNISSSYIALNDTNNAFKYLMMASEIFKNHKNDFHYQGFLSAMGKYYNLIKDYDNAIKYYEEALANIAMHSGKNKFYNDTLEELFNIYKIKKINPHISGIVLSKSYYNFTKNDFFKEIMDLKEYITIGLFGLGSECFYASDIISEDHDFDPGYIVLVNDNVSLDNFNRIKESYDKLEKRFKRYYVYNLDKKVFIIFQNTSMIL